MSATGISSANGLITSVRLRRTRRSALEERTHDFEERYAVEHEQDVERERAKRADSS